MKPIFDFARMTTDDLLQILPANETAEWEFKSAELFKPNKFGEFKKQKLGAIVSSFANSGGGYLLFGKRDSENIFDPVPTHEGRATMEDHLSLVISQSVIPHCRNFQFFRVPISGKSGEFVLIVNFAESPLAPHQSVADTNYFYRLPGHCQPAPHYFLELLRGRFTRAILKVETVKASATVPFFHGNKDKGDKVALCVTVTVEIHNASQQIADPCGMRVFCDEPNPHWVFQSKSKPLHESILMQCEPRHLYPSLSAFMPIELRAYLPKETPSKPEPFVEAIQSLIFQVQPLSQNFVGEPHRIEASSLIGQDAVVEMVNQHDEQLERHAKNMQEQAKELKNKLPDSESLRRTLRPY